MAVRVRINSAKANQLALGDFLRDLRRTMEAELPAVKAAYHKPAELAASIKVQVNPAGAGAVGKMGVFNHLLAKPRNAAQAAVIGKHGGDRAWERPTIAGLLVMKEKGTSAAVPSRNYATNFRRAKKENNAIDASHHEPYLNIYSSQGTTWKVFASTAAHPGKHALLKALEKIAKHYDGGAVEGSLDFA